jgi:hypothetical protein
MASYFTGRSTQTRQFYYSPNNICGKDSCPFITTPDDQRMVEQRVEGRPNHAPHT